MDAYGRIMEAYGCIRMCTDAYYTQYGCIRMHNEIWVHTDAYRCIRTDSYGCIRMHTDAYADA